MVRVARTLRRLAVMHNMGVCEVKTREGFHLATALNHTAVVTGKQGSHGLFGLFSLPARPPTCAASRREKDEQVEIVEEGHGQQA